MPGKIKVKVLAGRNLPVMDRAGDTTDAFVEIKFGGITHKTDVCRKSLNPHWNSTEWYRFEVDESELQDEPLQLRLMDHDTYSANDAIGKVVISLAPLLARETTGPKGAAPPGGIIMSGWIPVFDTMHGVRGELNVVVKVELFSDFNKYKTSSCGVQFFHCPMIPPGYRASAVLGFVEELVVNDDPEYQWIDKIRTPRASNEARQVAFIKLSNQVQRLVGLKAAELGANAVIGYKQDFDLEGEAGVVARAIGTAVHITKLPTPSQPLNLPPCTQQQLKKCLDILAVDNESVTDLNQYFQTHQEELHKLLHILNPKTPTFLDDNDNDDDQSMQLTRQSSVKSYTGSYSIYQDDYVSQQSLRHLNEDQTELNKLLNRNDEDFESDGPFKKIKKIKGNFLLKRLSSLRSRKSDKMDDSISIKSNSSDTSRMSLSDIKNEFKKFKKIKKPKYRKANANKMDEGVGMASILARSVIHARTSLAAIVENQDSESPNSTLRRPSESEPNINMSDEDRAKKQDNAEVKKNVPEIHFTSLKNINEEGSSFSAQGRQRKLSESCPASPQLGRSENLLTLPGETGYFGSVSSALSGESSEIYSSSEEDDESSELRTDTDRSLETTDSIVRTLMKNDAKLTQQFSVPEIPPAVNAVGEDECTPQDDTLTTSTSLPNVKELDDSQQEQVEGKDEKEIKLKSSSDEDRFVLPSRKSSYHHHFKLHNPFSHKKLAQSFSAPSSPVEKKSFVYRSSKRIRNQLSKISKSNMIKSLSHYSLLPKKKHAEVKATLSQPNSNSDIPSKTNSRETVLGSPFLSYTDLMSLDKELVHGAEDIVPLDAVKTKLHKSDEFDQTKIKMYIGSEPVSRASLSGPVSPNVEKDSHHFDHHLWHKKEKPAVKPTGLVHTAMETILMDKVQSLLMPATPDVVDRKFFDNVNEKLEKVEEDRNNILAQERDNLQMEVVRPAITPDHTKEQSSIKSNMSSGLIHTAMETMLIDKVQSIIPTADVQIDYSEDLASRRSSKSSNSTNKNKSLKSSESSGMIHTAMETMLLDKVQSIVPATAEPKLDETSSVKQECYFERLKDDGGLVSTGLVRSAMETILIDKVQSLFPKCKDGEIEKLGDDDKVPKIVDVKLKDLHINDDKEKVVASRSETIVENVNDAKNIEDVTSIETGVETIPAIQSLAAPAISETDDENITKSHDSLETKRKLIRQDSVHSTSDSESRKMSGEDHTTRKVTHTPVLQHFHPLLSGPPLETIPSLPETSFDQAESLDVEGCETEPECPSPNSNRSVCDNSHAACHVDRNERDREREREKERGSPRHARHESCGGREPPPASHASTHASSTPLGIHRRSSDSDLSITPKGSSLNASVGNTGSGGGAILRPSMNSNNLDMLEYPFLTMTEYPPGFIVHLGGTVCARSVKLSDGAAESGARAACWAELRTELRAHARALRCNAVLAYCEGASVCEDVCVLSATGTAAVINLDCDYNADIDGPTVNGSKVVLEEESECCAVTHVPYAAAPPRAELGACVQCGHATVPAVLLSTCAKPSKLVSYGKAIPLTAVAARLRRAGPAAEPGARDLSDQLPFLEYELHKLLLAKLRMQGANALFSLQTQIAIGERCVIALASGTAFRLAALPPPTPPRIKASENDKEAVEIQKAIWDTFTANKVANGYDNIPLSPGPLAPPSPPRAAPPALALSQDKDACVLELDEAEDVETAKALATRLDTMEVLTDNLTPAPGAPPQAFVQVCCARLASPSHMAPRLVSRALSCVSYKLRGRAPGALAPPALHICLCEDELQLVISGAAIPLASPPPPRQIEQTHDDDIFTLDEEPMDKSERKDDVEPVCNGYIPTTVSLTPLPSLAGARVTRRVCALQLLFVRETTAVRELGGRQAFLHTCTTEVLAIVRAYTLALGGNALTSFYITQLILQDNAHKNQSQCLLSVGGDVVHVTY